VVPGDRGGGGARPGGAGGDGGRQIPSGISYIGVVVPCLLGTPVSSTTGLVDSLLLTH